MQPTTIRQPATRTLRGLHPNHIAELVDTFAEPHTGAWGVYQVAGNRPDHPIAVLAEAVEQVVFDEAGYGLDPATMDAEFGPYNPASVWSLIVHHATRWPVAAVRSIVGPSRGHKIVDDLATYWRLSWTDACALGGFDPDACFVEACTYSVLAEWRNTDRGWPAKLTLAVQSHMLAELDAAASTQIINPAVLRLFRRWGVPFRQIGDVADIAGSPFVAAFVPHVPGVPWLHTGDAEFAALFRHRDTSGRGGTRLEPYHLDHGGVATAHHAALSAQYAARGAEVIELDDKVLDDKVIEHDGVIELDDEVIELDDQVIVLDQDHETHPTR